MTFDPDAFGNILFGPGTAAEKVRALIYTVCPEFSDTPVYVFEESEVPEHLRLGETAGAWTSEVLDLHLEPMLRDCGEWRGRGCGMILRRLNWRSEGALQIQLLMYGLHEFAHYLDAHRPGHYTTTPRGELPDEVLKPIDNREQLTAAKGLDPWFRHGHTWIRLAAHLAFRARCAGLNVVANDLCVAGSRYGLSDSQLYVEALGDEPKIWRDRPLTDLHDVDPPWQFASRWILDTVSPIAT